MTKEQGATVSCNTTDFCVREITQVLFFIWDVVVSSNLKVTGNH